MSFKKTGQFIDDKNVLKDILSKYRIDNFSFTSAKSGIENATYIIEATNLKFVLRVYRLNKKTLSDIKLEVSFTEMLRTNGLPVPEVIENNSGSRISEFKLEDNTWRAILMEHVDGTHAEDYSKTLIHELATYQAKFHLLGKDFTHEKPTDLGIKILKEDEFIHLLSKESLTDPIVAALIARAEEYTYTFDPTLPRGYSHFDYDAENVLVDNEDRITGILDFDDLQFAPYVMCLAYTLWAVLITSDDPETIEEYLKVYQEIRPLSDQELASIAPIMLFRHYVLASLELLRGDLDEENLALYLKYEDFLSKQTYSK